MRANDDSADVSINEDNDDWRDQITTANISISTTPLSSSPNSSPAELSSSDADPLALPIEQDLPRPFDTVSNDLAGLGVLSIDDFLSNVTSSSAVFDVSFYVGLPETSAAQDNDREIEGDEEGQGKAEEQRTMRNMVARLHEASNKVFGSSDCMKFEYMEEDPKSKHTISRSAILTLNNALT